LRQRSRDISERGLVQYLRKNYLNFINDFIVHTLGFTLLLVAILLVLKPFLMDALERRNKARLELMEIEQQKEAQQRTARWEKRYRPVVTALVGAGVGFLVG